MAASGWPFLIPAMLLTAGLAMQGFRASAWVAGLAAFYIAFFFRDPFRPRPAGEAHPVVAPADGRVVCVEKVDTPLLPGGKALKIGIFLSVLDVHVNRTPLPGRIVRIERTPGLFLNALKAESAEMNERNDIHLDTPYGPVLLRQIAGVIARRIVCTVKEGQALGLGERVGLIRFGSRTEIYLPPDATPVAKVGDYVRGASTLVARMQGRLPGR